jgi:carbonic anhydrase/acetyltransferase-like protein (isoleucine patch superfamily)
MVPDAMETCPGHDFKGSGSRHERVGDRGYFMNCSHVGHDCQVGNDVIFATSATLGGHCEIGDFIFIGGLSAVHGGSLKASDKNADLGAALLQKIDLLFGIIDWLTILDPPHLAPARLIVCKPRTCTKTLVREPF